MSRDSKRRAQSKQRGQGKKSFYILIDGETEQWYLQQLKQKENLRSITIKPDLLKKKAQVDQYEAVMEASRHYDQSIWIVDFDTILKEEREFGGSGKSPLVLFNEYYRELTAIENVEVLVNTPCLEYWYLLHIQNTGRFYQSYNDLEGYLNAVPIQGYRKTRRYYTSGIGIYAKLKPSLNEAYQRAKALGKYDPENPRTAKAEIYRLFEIIEIEF